jgi:hypothetical protein
MTEVKCIFTVKPDYCSICLESRKLQCLLDHRRQVDAGKVTLSSSGKKDLKNELAKIISP